MLNPGSSRDVIPVKKKMRTFTVTLLVLALLSLTVYSDTCKVSLTNVLTHPSQCIFLHGTTWQEELAALKYVCSNADFDCSPIQEGGANFYPDTIHAHASWAIDAWFQSHIDYRKNFFCLVNCCSRKLWFQWYCWTSLWRMWLCYFPKCHCITTHRKLMHCFLADL